MVKNFGTANLKERLPTKKSLPSLLEKMQSAASSAHAAAAAKSAADVKWAKKWWKSFPLKERRGKSWWDQDHFRSLLFQSSAIPIFAIQECHWQKKHAFSLSLAFFFSLWLNEPVSFSCLFYFLFTSLALLFLYQLVLPLFFFSSFTHSHFLNLPLSLSFFLFSLSLSLFLSFFLFSGNSKSKLKDQKMNQDFYRVVFLPLGNWNEKKKKEKLTSYFWGHSKLFCFLETRFFLLPLAIVSFVICTLLFIYIVFLNLRSFRGKTPIPFEGRFTNWATMLRHPKIRNFWVQT